MINIGEDNDFSKAVCLNAAAGLVVNENNEISIELMMMLKNILSGQTLKQLENSNG